VIVDEVEVPAETEDGVVAASVNVPVDVAAVTITLAVPVSVV